KKKRGDLPRKPGDFAFGFPPVEEGLMFSIGPLNRFAKSKTSSLYLQEVPPGEYVYYGTTNLGYGACACMGTVSFEASAGTITTLRYDGVWLDKDSNPIGRGKMPEGSDTNDALVRVAMVIEPMTDEGRDPRLPSEWLRPAELRPVEFVPNWLGAEINRIAPIPGVLAYERDLVIDVKAQMAAEEEARRAKEAADALAAQEAASLASEAASDGDVPATTEAGNGVD
ncbi:MAG: hypothetical protein AAGK17_13695, partial [Pseudomonadota bacterium]